MNDNRVRERNTMATRAPEIDVLLATRRDLVGQLRAVEQELAKYRVKCPTCRCRILPGETCACCVSNAHDVGDEPLV